MLYSIKNDFLTVTANDFGAELTSIRSNKTGREFMWNADPAVWGGSAPILFPICGAVSDDTYEYNGKHYHMPKHGFARRMQFSVTEYTDTAMTFSLTETPETLENYPFRFVLNVRFLLRDDALLTTISVDNTDDKTMFFSVGAHPAFALEIGDTIVFEHEETDGALRMCEEGYLVKEVPPTLDHTDTLTITEHVFDDDALFFMGLKSRYVVIRHKNDPATVRVDFGRPPLVGFWAKPGARYTCVEPWIGISDYLRRDKKIEEKTGYAHLPSGCTFSYTHTITPSDGE